MKLFAWLSDSVYAAVLDGFQRAIDRINGAADRNEIGTVPLLEDQRPVKKGGGRR